MKKQLAILAIASAMTTSVFAADGTINFTGEIIDAACDVTPTTASQIVNLGKVSDKSLGTVGNTAAATSFKIDLASCPAAVSTASVKFDGVPYNGDTSAIALTPAPGAATGVGIEIRDADGSVLPLYTASQSVTLSQAATNSLQFSAAYVAKDATVTAGPADATATFSVVYN